jgi:hypothetical protein
LNDAAQAVPDDSDVALCCDSDEHELEWLAAMHQLSECCSVSAGVAQCARWGARKPFINAGWVALVGMVATLFSELSQLGVFVAFVAEHARELAQRQPGIPIVLLAHACLLHHGLAEETASSSQTKDSNE